jgi:hypothetical protein
VCVVLCADDEEGSFEEKHDFRIAEKKKHLLVGPGITLDQLLRRLFDSIRFCDKQMSRQTITVIVIQADTKIKKLLPTSFSFSQRNFDSSKYFIE